MTPKEIADKLPPEERKAYILSLQCSSTKEALSQTEEERLRHRMSAISKAAIAVPDAKTDEERVGARPLTFEESNVYETLRRGRGRSIADTNWHYAQMMGRNIDWSKAPEHMKPEKKGSVDEAKKNRAIEAFMNAKPVTVIKAIFKDIMAGLGLYKKPLAERVKERMDEAKEELKR